MTVNIMIALHILKYTTMLTIEYLSKSWPVMVNRSSMLLPLKYYQCGVSTIYTYIRTYE